MQLTPEFCRASIGVVQTGKGTATEKKVLQAWLNWTVTREPNIRMRLQLLDLKLKMKHGIALNCFEKNWLIAYLEGCLCCQ